MELPSCFWLTWRAAAVLSLAMTAAWTTQQPWVAVLGGLAYALLLLIDALRENRRLLPAEAGALGAGALAVVAAAVITSILRPMAFPFNLLISLGLGAALHFAVRNLLSSPAPAVSPAAETAAEYRAMLSQMRAIAARTQAEAQRPELGPAVCHRLGEIASVAASLVTRYQERALDYGGAAATLALLQQFDKVLVYYLKIKSGQHFLDPHRRRTEIVETEDRTLPMMSTALLTLGKHLDAGEVVDKKVTEGTLESMLRSLNLIGDPADYKASNALEGKRQG